VVADYLFKAYPQASEGEPLAFMKAPAGQPRRTTDSGVDVVQSSGGEDSGALHARELAFARLRISFESNPRPPNQESKSPSELKRFVVRFRASCDEPRRHLFSCAHERCVMAASADCDRGIDTRLSLLRGCPTFRGCLFTVTILANAERSVEVTMPRVTLEAAITADFRITASNRGGGSATGFSY